MDGAASQAVKVVCRIVEMKSGTERDVLFSISYHNTTRNS